MSKCFAYSENRVRIYRTFYALYYTIKAIPHEAIFGRKPRRPESIPENINLESLSCEEYINDLEKRSEELRETI